MSIIAGYMVPHPPMIMSEIGKGREKDIQDTIDAYESVAEDIASHRPDTIIISSPHSIMYADYFHISPGSKAYGDMAAFYAPEVSFSADYDTELVTEICNIADERMFPAGTLGEKNNTLDHGTMVPLYFICKKYTDFKLVRIGLSGLPYSEHYIMGQYIKEAVERSGRRAVYVASGDLSHKLQSYGPYGFAKEGPQYDERIMDVMGNARFDELLDFDEGFCDRASECGHRSFVMLAGAFDGVNVEARPLSHQDVTGVGYGICIFHPKGADASRRFLKRRRGKLMEQMENIREAEDAYVTVARRSVESYVAEGIRLDADTALTGIRDEAVLKDLLHRRAGAFVSIHKEGRLRGCIGTILPVCENLALELISNGISASTKDPRFSPITEKELSLLEYSVDILGEPEDIASKAELDVKRYGVIVLKGIKRGLLLPDLEGVDTIDEQIAIAKQKAGIREDDQDVKLQRFEVVRHK